MFDIRTLLKAKRQEARISHRYASYNANGQLRCQACGILIKHASAWEGHLGSKIHRSSVARERDEVMADVKSVPVAGLGRLADSQRTPTKQGTQHSDADDIPTKRRKTEQETNVPSTSNFSRIHASVNEDDAPVVADDTDLESEYMQFQREVLTIPDPSEKYKEATVVAEPLLFSDSLSGTKGHVYSEGLTAIESVLEEDHRRVEERELILDRLLDEERAQEEADMRVNLMKKRLAAVKKKRQSRVR